MAILKKTPAKTTSAGKTNEYSLTDAKAAFLSLVRRVGQGSEEFVFTNHGKRVAKLVPIADSSEEDIEEEIPETTAGPAYHIAAVEKLEPMLQNLALTATEVHDVAHELNAEAEALEKTAGLPDAQEQERRAARESFLSELECAVIYISNAESSLDTWSGPR